MMRITLLRHRFSALCVLLALAGTSLPAAAQNAAAPTAQASTPRPRILITNDDGIGSPALIALANALRPFSDVVISAPASNQSGMGQAVTILHNDVRVHQERDASGLLWISVYGTPADAMLYGLTAQGPFDLVVSGINKGENLGTISWISGTVGAARMAALNGTHAIAVSQAKAANDQYDFTMAARYTAQLARYATARPDAWPKLVSVNVPSQPTGVEMAEADRDWPLQFAPPRQSGQDASGDLLYRIATTTVPSVQKKSDRAAFDEQKISVTVLTLDPNGKKKKLPLMLLSLPPAP